MNNQYKNDLSSNFYNDSNINAQLDGNIIKSSQLSPCNLPIPAYWENNQINDCKNKCLIVFTAAFDTSCLSEYDIKDYYNSHNYGGFAQFNFRHRLDNNFRDDEINEVLQGLRKWKLDIKDVVFHYFFQRPFPQKQTYDNEKEKKEDEKKIPYDNYDLDFAIAALKQTILEIKPQSVLFLSAQVLHLVLQNFGKKEIVIETDNSDTKNFNDVKFDVFAENNNFDYDFIDSPLDWMRLQNFSEMSSKNNGRLTPPMHIELKLSDKKNSLHGQAKYKVLAKSLEKLLSKIHDINAIDYYERARVLAVALEFQHEQKYSEYSRKAKYNALDDSIKEKRTSKLQKGRTDKKGSF